jgi:site-specific recombinase XerD
MEEEVMKGNTVELENCDQRITVAKWSYMWYQLYKMNTDINAVYKTEILAQIENHILPYIGTMKVVDVKEIHLQLVMNHLAGGSKSLLGKVRTILKGIFKKAKKNKIITDDPAEDLSLPLYAEGHYRSLTEKERMCFFIVTEGSFLRRECDKEKIRVASMFYKTMYYCGLRGGEVAALQKQDIDEGNAGFWIRNAIKITGEFGKPKTLKGERFVPIPDPFFTELVLYTTGLQLDEYIFKQSKTGLHHTKASRHKMWTAFKKEMCFAAGNPIGKYGVLIPLNNPIGDEEAIYAIGDDLSPHCLRHTFCTHALLAGVPLQDVAEMMGHEDVKTTEIYNSHPIIALEKARITLNNYHALIHTSTTDVT